MNLLAEILERFRGESCSADSRGELVICGAGSMFVKSLVFTEWVEADLVINHRILPDVIVT